MFKSDASTYNIWFGLAIALVQLFDIVIHIATNQVEPIRILSNIIILLWVAGGMMGWLKVRFRPTAVGAVGAYLLLNLIFLALEGVTNEAQGGGLRVMLFVLIALTVALSALWVSRQ